MKARCLITVIMLAALGNSAPAQSRPSRASIAVDTGAMDAHLRFLSSDLLEGRAPATRGGRLAAEYIAAQFQALGLEPAGANGSFFQPVALVGMTPQPTLSWGKPDAMERLAFRDAFVAWAEQPEADVNATGEVVFVGYGIRAPEWQWDDYKGTELRGKILLMLVNDPGLIDSTVFLGRILTYYGRWTYKLEEAARQGAAGAILVHTPASATYPWDVVRSSWTVEQFKLDQPKSPSLSFAGWVTEGSARAALAHAGLNLDSLTRAAARRDFRPTATGLSASVRVQSALRRVQSENVAARLPGQGARAQQVVLVTAHWDHKGIGPAVRGDSIYNGAEDNASGVAAMLGLARTLSRDPTPGPARSILFLATTAEESGLLGSEAYVQRPLVPLAQTAAVLNLDVTNVRGATRDISALGLDRSSLGPMFASAARAEGLVVQMQPDIRGSFFRSDHFPFARAGVPALSIEPGVDFVGRPRGWGEEQERLYNEQNYHQPSDEYQEAFRYDGMAQQVRVTARVARAIAAAPQLPRWLPTSEFQRPAP